MQADEDEPGDGLDPGHLSDEMAKALDDDDCGQLTAIVVRAISLAARYRGRSQAQAEAIAYLKARVDVLEGRERDRLSQPPWPPRREMPGDVVPVVSEGQG